MGTRTVDARTLILCSLSHMEEATTLSSPDENRIAVVTGGNKGIGLEICRQLASNGVKVILTARDEKRGAEAVEKLKKGSGPSDVVFHRLDVTDRSSAASLADFIQIHFGKLDILVNNAAIGGLSVDLEIFMALKPADSELDEKDGPERMKKSLRETYEMAEECLKTNYYGTKYVVEALTPLLLSSKSGRIVNVSSTLGQLSVISSERIKQVLSDVEELTEDRVDEVMKWFLKDFKEGLLEANGWPATLAAYKVSKVGVNAYTRLLAKRHPTLYITCVNPGYVKTDLNYNSGILTVEEGAKGPVMLALMAEGSPSGLFYDQTKVSTF